MNTYRVSTAVSALTNDTFRPTFMNDTSKTAREQRAMNTRILADLKAKEIARVEAATKRMYVATTVSGFICVALLMGVIVGASHLAVAVAPYITPITSF